MSTNGRPISTVHEVECVGMCLMTVGQVRSRAYDDQMVQMITQDKSPNTQSGLLSMEKRDVLRRNRSISNLFICGRC